MHRRDFIKLAGLSSLALHPFVSFAFRKKKSYEEKLWTELVEYARWAPSPHNIQPWKLKIISPKNATVYYDGKRSIPHTDPEFKFMTVGMGIFIESISIAALAKGFELKTTFHYPDLEKKYQKGLIPFANIELIVTENKVIWDRELLKTRRTSRIAYKPTPVAENEIVELKEIARKHGFKFDFTNEKELVEWMLILNRESLFYDLDDQKTREELYNWLRFSDEQALENKDGLWSKCMNFPGWLMKAFFHQHEKFNHGKRKKIVSKLYLNSMHSTKTAGWIHGKFSTQQDWLIAGKMLTYFWLFMAKNNVYWHPFGSVITNPKAYSQLTEKLKFQSSDEHVWMLARMGYSKVPPRSLRLDVNQIIIT